LGEKEIKIEDRQRERERERDVRQQALQLDKEK
jgi:hypothetical protein